MEHWRNTYDAWKTTPPEEGDIVPVLCDSCFSHAGVTCRTCEGDFCDSHYHERSAQCKDCAYEEDERIACEEAIEQGGFAP